MKGIKMKITYKTFPNPDDFYQGPSDEELKKIEDELDNYSS